MNPSNPLTEADIEQALATGHRAYWRRNLEKKKQYIIRTNRDGWYVVTADDWSHRAAYRRTPRDLRQHGRVTTAALLLRLGLATLTPVGPLKIIRMRDGEGPRGAWWYTDYTVDLGRLSPGARAIAEAITTTMRDTPGGMFWATQAASGRRMRWSCDYKVYPHSGPYRPFERVAAEMAAGGWTVDTTTN